MLFFILILVMRFIIPINPPLGDGYWLSDNRLSIESGNSFKNSVLPLVVDYGFDEDFIIAVQKTDTVRIRRKIAENLALIYEYLESHRNYTYEEPIEFTPKLEAFYNDQVLYNRFKKEVSRNNSDSDQRNSELIADSLLLHNPQYKKILLRPYNYWILNKNTDELFGPYSRMEYLIRRVQLGVPDNLTFEYLGTK